MNIDKLRNHKCLVILPESNVIILDNLDMYEIIVGRWLQKLPAKATIDFKEMYGDGKDTAKANFTNPIFPVDIIDNKLIWDY